MEQTEYKRRPLARVSRKKYGIALAMLRDAMAAKNLSWRQRLRACELYLLIYGLEPHTPNRRDRKTTKALVSENAFDREAIAHVQRETLSQTRREARKEAERLLAEEAVAVERAERERMEQLRSVLALARLP